MKLEEKLKLHAQMLEKSYEALRQNFEVRFPGQNPLGIQDVNGRFILHDSLVSLVNAETALLRHGVGDEEPR
jgi:hypothetical protein